MKNKNLGFTSKFMELLPFISWEHVQFYLQKWNQFKDFELILVDYLQNFSIFSFISWSALWQMCVNKLSFGEIIYSWYEIDIEFVFWNVKVLSEKFSQLFCIKI